MTSLGERFGTLSLPVDVPAVAASPGRTLTVLDPGRRLLCNLFQAAIRAELQEAWTQACLGIDGATEKLSTTDPCADVLEMEPTASIMGQRQAAFPLLAVYRSGEAKYEPDTIDRRKLVQPWTVDWILGPATVARAFQLTDAAVAISKIIELVVESGGHPAYESGVNVLGVGGCNFDALSVLGHDGPGQARFANDDNSPTYWAITIRLESEEGAEPNTGLQQYGPFEGADYDLGIGGAPEGVLPGHFYASTDPPYQDP
jgi:hypothetical protein